MRIEDDKGWVALVRSNEDETFEAAASVRDFAGRNQRIWMRSETPPGRDLTIPPRADR